jgi:hypothetical protein
MALPSEQGEQQVTGRKARYGGESDTDPRLVEYIEALRAGDIDKLLELRLTHIEDVGLTRRFKTIDATVSGLMDVYVREIQILRLEVEGWKSICESQDRLAEPDIDRKETLAARQCQYRGLDKVERALGLRKDHTEVDVPQLSRT